MKASEVWAAFDEDTPETRSTYVRTVGPAALIILELEAPPRIESMVKDGAELLRLCDHIRSNPHTNHLCESLFDHLDANEEKVSSEGLEWRARLYPELAGETRRQAQAASRERRGG